MNTISKYTNLLSTISLVLTALTGLMAKLLNCTSTGDLTATCTGNDLIPAAYMGYAAVIFAVLTLAIKSIRPGGFFSSWFGQTAVVVPEAKAKPGVVTPSQVAAK